MKISSFFKPLSFIPALLLMYMIYSFSGQTGDASSSVSYKVSEKIVQGVNIVSRQGWQDWEIQQKAQQINKYVRKGAHMTEYFLLAIAVSFPLYVYGVRGILLMLLAGLICVGYACGDEYHQSFVSGRSPSFRDVGIDSIGVFAGILLVRLFGWSARVSVAGPRIERRQRRQQEELDRREEELAYRERMLDRRERLGDRYDLGPGGQEDTSREVRYPEDGYPEDGYPEDGYPEHRYTENGYPGTRYPEDDYRDDRYEEDTYEDGPDEDSSDELADDIPLFRRRKHRKH